MNYVIPVLVLVIVGYGMFKKVNVYDAFLKGAKEGLNVAIAILPSMGAMLVAIALMRESGLLMAITSLLAPIFSMIGILPETAPLMLMRPFSGSASLAMLSDIFATHGADSDVGMLASTLMGSSETIFYTVSIYLAAAKVTKSGYAIPAALIAWLVGSLVAGLIC